MFTGLVEKICTVQNFKHSDLGAEISIILDSDIKLGDSIAINGVCLTATSIKNDIVSFDVMNQTLELTNLKYLKKGDKVNVERAMSVNSRFDGSIVSGHIDKIAPVISIEKDGFSKRIKFLVDTELIIEQGSIVVNGVSLTVSKLGEDFFEVSLIPATLKDTNLDNLKKDDLVNIEFDMVGKYIYKFMNKKPKFKITKEFLVENGF